MKKVGIITITGYHNYGNMLQNYATQEVIKELGFHPVTIDNAVVPTAYKIKPPNVTMLTKIRKRLDRLIHKKSIREYREYQHKKKKIFAAFKAAHIEHTEYCISENNIPEDLSDSFDFFVTGSDQVWNPYYRLGSGIDFLSFAPPCKRIAYSPSFGVSEIPEILKAQYSVWLKEMHRLSVREESGAGIISELTGRNAPVLIDPTLMLTKEKWLAIAKEAPAKPEKQYLLTYFLGTVPQKYRNKIQSMVEDNDLEIVNLLDLGQKQHFLAGPGEFIDYFHSAAVIVTDSFHGTVFSILMEKPFLVTDRTGNIAPINSRIETLLSMFGLKSRRMDRLPSNQDIFSIEYSHVAETLDAERKKTILYLREALHSQNHVER